MAAARGAVQGPLNLCSDEEISIADLARLIVELSEIDVPICFDDSKPDGQPRRAGDGQRAKKLLGFSARVPLTEGIKKTIRWYENARFQRDAVP
jgi:GDP-L-fucose synthase